MAHRAVQIGQRRIVAPPIDQPARRGHLEGHADRALRHRPRDAIARIKCVEDLAIEIGEAPLIEAPGVVLPEEREPVGLRLRHMRIAGIGRGREIIGRIAAHLVQIDDDVRHPVEQHPHAAAALGLGLREPVAIEVEEIMVRPAARPRLVVFGGGGLVVGRGRLPEQVLEDESRAPIRVLHRIDEHDRFAADDVDIGIVLRREQMICLGHGGLARRDLVPVHAVRQDDHHRQLPDQRLDLGRPERRGIRQPLQARANRVELPDALRTRHEQRHQRPPLPGLGVLHKTRPLGRRLAERPQIPDDLLRRRHSRPRLVADDLLQRRDGCVIPRPRRKLQSLRADGRGEQTKQNDSKKHVPPSMSYLHVRMRRGSYRSFPLDSTAGSP